MARGTKKIIDNPLHNFKNVEYVKNGRYFEVIDDDKMDEVFNKIDLGNYLYQK